jgi:DNA-binding transcriptional MerR regulator
MDAHLSIGDFSRMTFVSVKALRHYHEVGLLAPAFVDPDSGYRRYAVAQVPTAQAIRRLRELGMGLDDIAAVVQAPDVGTRNALIGAHLRRMEDQLEATRATVASLRALLEHGPAAVPVSFRCLARATVLALAAEVTADEMHGWLDDAFGRLETAVSEHGLERAGPVGALFASELLEDERGELVAFIPVADARDAAWGRVLPETEYAIAIHHGAFEDLDRTYGALGTAVAERAIGVDGPIRENYVVGADDTPDESQHRTEVCWPVFQTVR